MNHEDIKQKVRDILNEHGGEDVLMISEDRVLLDSYIDVAIPDAVTLLANKGYRVNAKVHNERTGDKIVLPGDFVSVLKVKLDAWKRWVTKLTEVGSPEYNMAMNEFTTPGINRPMCYKDGNVLICLPEVTNEDTGVKDGFTLEYNALYNEGVLNAEPKEAAAVCYMAAAIVMGLFGDENAKKSISEVAVNMLG